MAHSTSGGDHTAGGGLKGLDGALLQSQLVCLLYVAFSVCVTMYRGTCVKDGRRWLAAPSLCLTPPPSRLRSAFHNDGWHLPMVAALAFSTYLKMTSRDLEESHKS